MIDAVLDAFRPGRTIYLPGGTGESLALATALGSAPERMRDVHLVSCLLPGINQTDYAGLHPTARLTVFMLSPALRASFEAGRIRALPLSYTGIAAYLGQDLPVDTAIAHVAPPDEDGFCSLGIAADFTPLVWPRAGRRIAIINEAMPAMRRGPRIALADADLTVTVNAPLICSPPYRSNAELTAIAKLVAGLVPDSAAIQLGIGGAPAVVWPFLSGHRDLTIASGMVTDETRELAEAGALRPGAFHRTGVAYGSTEFYRYLAESDLIAFASTPETHGIGSLAKLNKFTSINAALEVDLLGQVNAEWRDGKFFSGVGGAPDFARAAAASPGGRSIIALPATAKSKNSEQPTVSKIVPKLTSPSVSLGRNDIDTVVTEHGVAELRGLSLDERAQALIKIAAPAHRDELAEAWREIRKSI
jgi:acyl-CoA hydrolase